MSEARMKRLQILEEGLVRERMRRRKIRCCWVDPVTKEPWAWF